MEPVNALIGLAMVAIVGSVFLARAYGEIDDKFVAEWSRAHQLDVTPGNRPMVWWYLRNARVLRTIGVLSGFVLPMLLSLALGLGDDSSGVISGWLWPFAGYLFAAVYAELALTRPSGLKGGASLVPRILADYLPRRLVRMQRTLGVLALVVATAALLVPQRPASAAEDDGMTWLAVPILAAVLGLALERLQAWVVQRPQPLVSSDLVAADDAIRSQSVHSISGSGMAIQLLAVSEVCVRLGDRDLPWALRTLLVFPAAFGYLAALWCCLYFGHRAWKVHRQQPAVVT